MNTLNQTKKVIKHTLLRVLYQNKTYSIKFNTIDINMQKKLTVYLCLELGTIQKCNFEKLKKIIRADEYFLGILLYIYTSP